MTSTVPDPILSNPTYENFDFVQYADILDHILGSSNNETVITSWIFPTALTSNISDRGVNNVFISKDGNLELGISEDGHLQVYIKTTGAETTAEYGTFGGIALDQWTYIAVRYDKGDVDVLIGDTWYTSAIGGMPGTPFVSLSNSICSSRNAS